MLCLFIYLLYFDANLSLCTASFDLIGNALEKSCIYDSQETDAVSRNEQIISAQTACP